MEVAEIFLPLGGVVAVGSGARHWAASKPMMRSWGCSSAVYTAKLAGLQHSSICVSACREPPQKTEASSCHQACQS